ncbi:hypothetical protein DPMN_178787 [Dreissena polymorpha]|uniref:Uncharacterized protein n=1 Tax=Dreissena polymorpha TaxID=45954 RepID=A0A9D4EFX9_DREPO|nr:hypothetical protein DPMN_178787 [Dreissena polymorpha]
MFSFSLRLYSRLGKRPPTSFLLASRFLASHSSFPQILAICSAYASRAQRHVFLRCCLFHFVLGFQVSERLPCFYGSRLLKGVAYPLPKTLNDVVFNWLLFCSSL